MKLEITQNRGARIAGFYVLAVAILGFTLYTYFQSAILFIIGFGILFFPKEQKKDEVKPDATQK